MLHLSSAHNISIQIQHIHWRVKIWDLTSLEALLQNLNKRKC